MVADVIFTIAVVSVAAGAVTELQIGMGNVCPAADGAAVIVGDFGCCGGCLTGAGIEGDGLAGLSAGSILCTACIAAGVDPPGLGQHIQHILAEEQEVIGQGDQAEEIVGEGASEEVQGNDGQIDEGKDPGLYGDDEEQQEVGIGIHGGITQEHAQIQISDIRLAAKDQTPDIHQHHTGEIEEVKLESSPAVFHGPAQRPVAEQGNGNEQQIVVSGAVNQGEGHKPPDLTVEDALPVEAKQGIQAVVSGHLADDINNGSACGNIQHQIGNALITVPVAHLLKPGTQIFQYQSLLKWFCIF